MKRYTVAFAMLSLLFFSCGKDNSASNGTDNTPPVAAQNMLNVAYGTDAAQTMDVYLPVGRSTATTKTIIMIHGGSWIGGDKADMTPYVDSLQRRLPGYAVININYRLATFTGNTFPTQETDVKAATDFIYNKRSDYKISDKFVMLGVSAGSHLALLQAYKNATPKIKAVVDFFGPNDMADMYNNPASTQAPPSGIAILLNGVPPSTLYTSSSPINFVNPQTPPTIILHGGLDPLVRYQQAVVLSNKLMLNSVAQQYVFYPAEGHGWVGADLTDSFDKVQAFLTLYVQ